MLKCVIAHFEGKVGVGIGANNENGQFYLILVCKALDLIIFDGTNGISFGLSLDFLCRGFYEFGLITMIRT